MVDRGGLTNLLAMPYRDGLTITAINHGERPISGVGATVSYEPLPEADDARLQTRLHGIFQAGGAERRELITQSGRGRWIALISQRPANERGGLESLVVDGQDRPAWTDLSWRSFLGFPAEAGEVRRSLSGSRNGLVWRYLLLEPVDFSRSVMLRGNAPAGDTLALYYLTPTHR